MLKIFSENFNFGHLSNETSRFVNYFDLGI